MLLFFCTLICVPYQIKFPSAFNLPPSLIKLTQAFWLLDHEDFDEALSMLLDPLIVASDITPAQHRSACWAGVAKISPSLHRQCIVQVLQQW